MTIKSYGGTEESLLEIDLKKWDNIAVRAGEKYG